MFVPGLRIDIDKLHFGERLLWRIVVRHRLKEWPAELADRLFWNAGEFFAVAQDDELRQATFDIGGSGPRKNRSPGWIAIDG